jgi:hypothetical protein
MGDGSLGHTIWRFPFGDFNTFFHQALGQRLRLEEEFFSAVM